MMKAKIIMSLALMPAVAISGAPVSARAADLASVSIGAVGSGSANNWPTYIAMEKGFFKDAGITVTFLGIHVSSSVQQQLAAGSIDIGSGGTVDPLRAIGNGAAIALLRIEVAKAPYYIYVQPDIHDWAQLKGKTVSIGGPRDITHYYFDRMAVGEGLDPTSCNFTYGGSTVAGLAGLASGAVDAAILNPPYIFLAQAKGFRELPVRKGFDKGLPYTVFAVNVGWAESHKKLVRKFLDAYNKGVAWFYDPAHRSEAINILLKKIKVTPNEAEKTYDIYVKGNLFVRKDTIDKSDLQAEIDVIKRDGSLLGSTDFTRFYKPAALGLQK